MLSIAALSFNCTKKNKEDICNISSQFDGSADSDKCEADYNKKKRGCVIASLYRIQTAEDCLRNDPNNKSCISARDSSFSNLACCPKAPCL